MLKLTRRGKKGIFQISGTLLGERVRESTLTSSEEHAQVKLADRQKEILDRYAWGEERTATFAEAAVLYLNKGGESRFLDPLLDEFGMTRLADMTDSKIATFAAKRYPNAGPQGINRQVYTPIIAVFRAGARATPPLCAMPKFQRPKRPKRKKVPHVRDDYLATIRPGCSERLWAALMLITFTAARASEACRLVDEDVEWEAGYATLQETKNGETRRVKLPMMVIEAMTPLKGTKGALFGFKTRHSLNQALERAARRTGLPYLSSHKVGRHTFAARHLRNGRTLKEVAEMGGWKSIPLVAETYGHLERSHVDELMASSDTELAQLASKSDKVTRIQAGRKPKSTMSR